MGEHVPMVEPMVELRDRWPLGAELVEIRDELLAAYGSGRGYHDARHLTEVLDRLDELAEHEGFDRTTVGLAAWFHDAVYDGQPGAEDRSARWAEQALSGRVDAEEVGRLVRLTESHRPAPDDIAGGVLCDADLAILAAPANRYAEYAADVRREYADVPEELFRAGRAAVLGELMAKESLFHTAYARAHWGAAARANVEAELARLAG